MPLLFIPQHLPFIHSSKYLRFLSCAGKVLRHGGTRNSQDLLSELTGQWEAPAISKQIQKQQASGYLAGGMKRVWERKPGLMEPETLDLSLSPTLGIEFTLNKKGGRV